MAEKINVNVFDAEKKFVDFAGLDYFWEKAKKYVDDADLLMGGRVVALENTVGDSTKGLVKDVKSIQDELNSLSGGAGSIATQINNAIAALDLPNTYDAKGAAADALDDAKDYADGLAKNYDAAGTAAGLDSAMDARVKVLEAIDHDKLAADAASAAVAGVIDGAPEKFDTLKEIAAWIAEADTAEDAASLVTRVATLEAINHDAYKAADETVLASAKSYADGLAGNYDAAGSAADALADAKDYVDGKVDGKFDAAGSAAQALTDAKSYADGKFQVAGNYEVAGTAAAAIEALKLAETYDAKGAAADAKDAAIAQAKVDAAEALKAYYTKTEVDNLLSTNSTGDRAYAKQYTDELFGSFQFAANSDIDALFA